MKGHVKIVPKNDSRLFTEDSTCLGNRDGETFNSGYDTCLSTFAIRIGRGTGNGSLQVPKKNVWSMSIADV